MSMGAVGAINAGLSMVLAVVAVGGAILSWIRWGRPRWRKLVEQIVGVRDAILGRDPVRDTITGAEIEPALPGIGVRMAHQEEKTDRITGTLEKLVDQQETLIKLHERVDGIDVRVRKLEEGAVERIVTRAESAEAFRAIQAVAGQNPDGLEQPDLVD